MAQNPRPQTPNDDPELHSLNDPGRSFAEQMAGTVDDLRQLATDFGLRPYRVFSVVTGWSGGDVGRGNQTVLRETEFLPTPNVELDGLRTDPRDGGRVERGAIRMSAISPRYTEDDIQSLFPRDLKKSEQAFVEVRMDARDGTQVTRRRFGFNDVPYRRPDRWDWAVTLTPQDDRRSPAGALASSSAVMPRSPIESTIKRDP